ncbi:GTP-binding protein [Stackebrandtia soli]|uniref:GTP-binding protein n=1 Tax=Stackebrandtia soli TaxID=1892856 RepID=UPI0039E802A0
MRVEVELSETKALSVPMTGRQVALIGKAGVGKSTLAASLRRVAGAADGRQIHPTTGVEVTVAEWRGVPVTVLDTPGDADFVSAVRAGLRGVDGAIFVVSAVDGLDAGIQLLWEECGAVGLPRAVVVTGLDDPRADMDETVALAQRLFGDTVLPIQLPLLGDDEAVAGLIDLITADIRDYSTGLPPIIREPETVHWEGTEEARETLIETVIADSEDETLPDRYLSGEEIPDDALVADMQAAVGRGVFYPALPVDARTGVGVDVLLDLIVDGFPPPGDATPPPAMVNGEPAPPLSTDPAAPAVASILRANGPQDARTCLVRVHTGTVRTGSTTVAGESVDVRKIHNVYTSDGSPVPALTAGELGMIELTGPATAGDTVTDGPATTIVEPWERVAATWPIAIAEDTDARALAALRELARDDRDLRLAVESGTGQLLLWCVGETHATVTMDRLRRNGHALPTAPVAIAVRGTVTNPATATGETGVVCTVTPLPTETGTTIDRADPHLSPDGSRIEHGARLGLAEGGFPGVVTTDLAVDVSITGAALTLTGEALERAVADSVSAAVAAAGPILLEPVDLVRITLAQSYVRPVLADLTARRGVWMRTDTDDRDRAVITAHLPAIELNRYIVDLRELSAGSGFFDRQFDHHRQVPVDGQPTILSIVAAQEEPMDQSS